MFSFKLNKDFVSKYKNVRPDWGFTDAAGSSLGEITFLRTYSRKKEDGTKEQWYEVCERVINGMYSLQKDYAKANRLPWSDSKAQASAQEAFDRMFRFKWTPPGRGLWVMGTPLVNEHKNSAALQNCFAPDTKIITREGVRTLGELRGRSVEVWAAGDWRPGRVESFGMQPVQRVEFAPFGIRSNHRVVEVVTPDHRWELRDGSTTTNLKVGDVVPGAVVTNHEHDETGFLHGLMFADGSVNYRYANGDFGHMMRLCGDKERFKDRFDRYSYQPNCNGDPVVYHRAGFNMKELPSTEDPNYVRSFIQGWLEFDGSNGAISTQNEKAARWLEEHAAIGGFQVVGHTAMDNETNFGKRSAQLHRIKLVDTAGLWTVKSITPLGITTEVLCAVVDGFERFTLASGVYTSNCAFVSTGDMTRNDPAKPFKFLMEASMLGVGVGFDLKGADKGFKLHKPVGEETYVIPDTREGWVESVGMLIEAFLKPGKPYPRFDYSQIRPEGAPIKTFGGQAAGPEPLKRLHSQISEMFEGRDDYLTGMDILDIMNLIGVCVVAGNVRRSAELAIGEADDLDFINAKNPEVFPERNSYDPETPGWAWMSNNSVVAKVGQDLSHLADRIAANGEPGVIWLDLSRDYGRLVDMPNGRDYRVKGYNPCAEQSLESFEMCTLVETYPSRHEDLKDYLRTLKFAYLYAKTVTLLPTHWEETNAIMARNRRIGTSASGISDFVDTHSWSELRVWMDTGYEEIQKYDRIYSEWLCVRESIKTTTVKPSGTVSILAGVSPGVHWSPGGRYFLRRIRLRRDDPMVEMLRLAGYTIEPAAEDPKGTVVVGFPIKSQAVRSERDVTIFEKAHLAAEMQRYWSDNSVSVTLSFDPETEGKHIPAVLSMYDGKLKTVSFLPMSKDTYPQMPYESITKEEYEKAGNTFPVDLSPIYEGLGVDAIGERYCTTDACMIKEETSNVNNV